MGFRTGSYAKIWKSSPSPSGRAIVAEMSTSKKSKDGKYETDWSSKYVMLIGEAAKTAEGIADGSTVRIGECEVTNKWDAEKKTLCTNYAIYSFQKEDTPPKKKKEEPTSDDEDLPFN